MKLLKKDCALFLTACTATGRCYISVAERIIAGEIGLALEDYYDMNNEVTFGFDLMDALKLEYHLGLSIKARRTFKIPTGRYNRKQQKTLLFKYSNMTYTVEAAVENRVNSIKLGLDEVHAIHRWVGTTADALIRLELSPNALSSNRHTFIQTTCCY